MLFLLAILVSVCALSKSAKIQADNSEISEVFGKISTYNDKFEDRRKFAELNGYEGYDPNTHYGIDYANNPRYAKKEEVAELPEKEEEEVAPKAPKPPKKDDAKKPPKPAKKDDAAEKAIQKRPPPKKDGDNKKSRRKRRTRQLNVDSKQKSSESTTFDTPHVVVTSAMIVFALACLALYRYCVTRQDGSKEATETKPLSTDTPVTYNAV